MAKLWSSLQTKITNGDWNTNCILPRLSISVPSIVKIVHQCSNYCQDGLTVLQHIVKKVYQCSSIIVKSVYQVYQCSSIIVKSVYQVYQCSNIIVKSVYQCFSILSRSTSVSAYCQGLPVFQHIVKVYQCFSILSRSTSVSAYCQEGLPVFQHIVKVYQCFSILSRRSTSVSAYCQGLPVFQHIVKNVYQCFSILSRSTSVSAYCQECLPVFQRYPHQLSKSSLSDVLNFNRWWELQNSADRTSYYNELHSDFFFSLQQLIQCERKCQNTP